MNCETSMNYDIRGHRREKPAKGMLVPVRCNRCGEVYDLTEGKVVAQYTDCTVFITPCCKRQVDDRTFVSCPAITRLDKNGNPQSDKNGNPQSDKNGNLR